jgi:protein-S-isoprenylcysteine O-methyltransferase Ste14
MTGSDSMFGKSAYALLFTVMVPLGLVIWANQAEISVPLPMPEARIPAVAATIIGLILVLWGMVSLWKLGRGLPMNPYPPPNFVTGGIYRYLAHPIYVGFTLGCVGVSLLLNSRSGFWLVSPILALACTALVLGFERHDLDTRFGPSRWRPLITLPGSDDSRPGAWERLSVYLLVLVPWLLAYEMVIFLGIPRVTWSVAMPFEQNLRVCEWWELVYASTYLWVCLAPLIAKKRIHLREFAVSGVFSTLIGIGLFLALPIIYAPRPFEPQTLLGKVLMWERLQDSSMAAFPAFHLIWALLAARLYSQSLPSLRFLWIGWVGAIAVSCVATGMHALADLAAAAILTTLVWHRRDIWTRIRSFTERFSNSWHEWHLGPIRIINHSLYAGLAAFLGLLVVSSIYPEAGTLALLLITVASLAGGAVFAQTVEGSPGLLRPFGYFGSVIGAAIGIGVTFAFPEISFWQLLGSFAIAAPIIQAGGRLRCLVQGCCHGRASSQDIQGIRYWHPSSRVSQIASLGNIPIYPTPLYSITWNLVIFAILFRLWTIGIAASLITGLYFILAGCGRFVEESYRGEPQTPVLGGMRIYHWYSIGFVLVGVFATCLPSPSMIPRLGWSWGSLVPALIGGFLSGAAMGVDFPASHRRFARLTG